MSDDSNFEMRDFLPYVLAQAAEQVSLEFAAHYRNRYGMLRTEWRVLFHLGRYGPMTATEIGRRARLHKTKISRAVAKLEARRFLTRATREDDRRWETLSLTKMGEAAYDDLRRLAERYDAELMQQLDPAERDVLRSALLKLAQL
ncbi:MarR family winged helix-turn-helix transcriptional regulator [Pseudaestuariivita atlantica]|uniref:MarR family transcriptional regulator n=1 Tax=Pseudaestuariivita atlantica TaxID=1317121 RepID=A0A0L1JNT5_9RHOB|nr:MarR family transcriptional regulator [Pseudaestuariivita atlantica]KNG93377.1 MarR family transcriptional regulator [Pseudaestuariivita atlantica]